MRTGWRIVGLAAAVLLSVCLGPSPCRAFNQGRVGINLGLTSFFDGFGKPNPGFVYQSYLQYGWARQINDHEGNKIDVFKNTHIDAMVWINQMVYFLPETVFNGKARLGFNFVLPLIGFRTHFDQGGPILTSNGGGFGDITIGPLLQFDPIMRNGRPVFSHRLGLDWFAPTGKYNPDRSINQGTNYTSFNPSWAATVLPLPHVELTARLNYMYNWTNDRPTNPPRGLKAQNAKAGQDVWINFAASYEVIDNLHVGVNGYYYKQITDDRFKLADGTYTEGKAQGEARSKIIGVGPGAHYNLGHHDLFFANFYYQTGVVWRPPTHQVNLRWIHSF
jgi:hypothetical protein